MIIFEDDDLLVVNKPAGWNTHSPSPFAGEGIYEWLKNREPQWANLSILHRLDKETSGAMIFGKTPAANRSLTNQFTEKKVRKKYLLLTDRGIPFQQLRVKSVLTRAGERYLSRPIHLGSEIAETYFTFLGKNSSGQNQIQAEPVTGKTHQIRAHASANGFPILGDVLYGGTASGRVFLHAQQIEFNHPISGQRMTFSASANFLPARRALPRQDLFDASLTNAYRIIHGASDGWPGLYVDRLGDFLLSQSDEPLTETQQNNLKELLNELSLRGLYHKILRRQMRRASDDQVSPQYICGDKVPEKFLILENGTQFSLSFDEGYSVGLFLDQRENRRRFLNRYIAPHFFMKGATLLNTFSYACGFSVCAAKSGAHVTSVDLSKKYLEWGKRNFGLNKLNPDSHDFIYGDVFDWMKRFARKGRRFDVIILDPPTFSHSKEQGAFRAEKDFAKLVSFALPLLNSGGILFSSTNAANLKPENFLETIAAATTAAKRKIVQQHYVPQPFDFPISRAEPAYLKTVWMKID